MEVSVSEDSKIQLTEIVKRNNLGLRTSINKNIDSSRWGVKIWNGHTMTEELIRQSDVVMFTGTTFVNGTFEHIMRCIRNFGKEYLIYGVTGAGLCRLMGLKSICPFSGS